jgi:hypothetical protein
MADMPSPQPGTIAYAEWKRRQEQEGSKAATQQAGDMENGKTRKTAKAQAGKEIKKYTGKEVSKEIPGEVGKETGRSVGKGARQETSKPPLVEDLPNHKVGYYFTQAEIDRIDELQHILIHEHRLRKVSKNDIVRTAVEMLVKDFDESRSTSFLVRKLTRK